GTVLIKTVAQAQEGAQVRIAGGSFPVRTNHADLLLTDTIKHKDYFFEGLTIVNGPAAFVQSGDSGSPVLNASRQPVGIVIGATDGVTDDNPHRQFGAGAAVCDLQRIIGALQPQAGPLQIL